NPVSRAKFDTKTLEKAATIYKQNFGEWPESLEVLAKDQPDGRAAFIDPANLVDPWGTPYHYDPKQLHPETGVPQIWTDGPPGSAGRFANWGGNPWPGSTLAEK